MLTIGVRSLAAWAPGVEEEAQWRAFARAPFPLAAEGVPDAAFLPAMLRRRCSPLSKAMLRVAFSACPEAERSAVRAVFASRHGENRESFPHFEQLVAGQPLSPTRFTHTVHNAQASLFSIATGNRCASSAIAAEGDGFGAGILEAFGHLQREPARPVLLVVGDVPAADFCRDLTGEPVSSHAVALLLAHDGEAPQLGYEFVADGADGPASHPASGLPAALAFVRFWHGDAAFLELPGPRSRHRFTRLPEAAA